jgi:anti-sigma factor RsiW
MRKHMSDLLDRELNPAWEAKAKSHLRQCPACAREYRDFQALVKTCRKLPELDLSRACHEKLRRSFKKWASASRN